jgi:predicted ABC-class ATPase
LGAGAAARRNQLKAASLLAFVRNGAILPRKSGNSTTITAQAPGQLTVRVRVFFRVRVRWCVCVCV